MTCEIVVDKSLRIDAAKVAKVSNDAAKLAFTVGGVTPMVAVTVSVADVVTIDGKPASVLAKVANLRMGQKQRRDLISP